MAEYINHPNAFSLEQLKSGFYLPFDHEGNPFHANYTGTTTPTPTTTPIPAPITTPVTETITINGHPTTLEHNGTSSDNIFNLKRQFIEGNFVNIPIARNIDGKGGTNNELHIEGQFDSSKEGSSFGTDTAKTVKKGLSNIHVVDITPTGGPGTISFDNVDDAIRKIKVKGATQALIVKDLLKNIEIELANTDKDLTVKYQDSSVLTGAEIANITLNDVGGGQLTFEIDGVDKTKSHRKYIINIKSGDSTLSNIVATGSTSVTQIDVAGDKKFTLTGAMPSTITGVDASAMTTGGAILFNQNAGHPISNFTGSIGDDTMSYGANWLKTYLVDGGAGIDTVKMTAAQFQAVNNEPAALSDFKNVETIELTTASSAKLTTLPFAGVTKLITASGSDISNGIVLANNSTVELSGAITGGGSITAHGISSNGVLNAKMTSITGNPATTFSSDWATVNIESAGANALGTTTFHTGAGATKVVITGNSGITWNAAVNAAEIDGSALPSSAALVMSAANPGSIPAIVKGGAGADTIVAGATGGSKMYGNAGADTYVVYGVSSGVASPTELYGFDLGTSTSAADKILISVTHLETLTTVSDIVDTSTNSAGATDGTVVDRTATVSNADMVKLSGVYADDAAALAGMKTSQTDYFDAGSAFTDNDAILVAYKTHATSGDIHVAVVTTSAATTSSNDFDSVETVAKIMGQAANFSNLDSSDFEYIA